MGYRDYIVTIEDLEKLYYSKAGARFVQKDAPVISTTTGVYNTVYGAQVWAQLNQEANAFGVLPKYPWTRSGFRVITARAASSGGGVAENAALPATIKPTFAEVEVTPKTIAHTFDVSEVHEFLAAESEDDYFGAMAHMRPIMGLHHKEMINVALLTDVSTEASGASADRAAADKYNFESIDRIVSNDSEEDAFGGTYDNWFDIYAKDRDTATTGFEAYVSHNSGTDRALTDTLLRTLLWNCGYYGGNTSLFITRNDTYAAIQGMFEAQIRYNPLGQARVSIGVNGIQTKEGLGFGIDVATLYGIPLIVSKDTPQDTIGRIYALDTSDPEGFGVPRLGISIAKPTQYFEAGMLTGDPFGINRIGTEGMYRTLGEIICRFFVGQGKTRDLK